MANDDATAPPIDSLPLQMKVNDAAVTVTFDMLTIVLLVASILYTFCLILSTRKLRGLHRVRPQLSTKKLLLMSVAVTCAVRIMTILGVAAMNQANIKAHYSLQPKEHHDESEHDRDQEFYDKAMFVLFDLPNCCVVSTYILLTIVWAELNLENRFHTEDPVRWRNFWLRLNLISNSLLYISQLVLYTAILVATDDRVQPMLYAGITGINFLAVLMVLTNNFYLNFRFSGFPFRRSLRRISSVMTLWSVTRIIWGIATLCVFLFNIELLQESQTPFWSFLVLLLLLFVCEILPVIFMLDYSYMNMIGITAHESFGGWYPHNEIDPVFTSPLLRVSDDDVVAEEVIPADLPSGAVAELQASTGE